MRTPKLNQLVLHLARSPRDLNQSHHSQCHNVCLELSHHTDDQQPLTIDDGQTTLASYADRAKPNVTINGLDAAFASQMGEIAAM
jgi:hypothetical protein